jgi:hypothetical protein
MRNRDLLKTFSRCILVSVTFAAVPGVAEAADWVISRAKGSGACHVQLETSRPYLGELLPGKYPTRKVSCAKSQ